MGSVQGGGEEGGDRAGRLYRSEGELINQPTEVAVLSPSGTLMCNNQPPKVIVLSMFHLPMGRSSLIPRQRLAQFSISSDQRTFSLLQHLCVVGASQMDDCEVCLQVQGKCAKRPVATGRAAQCAFFASTRSRAPCKNQTISRTCLTLCWDLCVAVVLTCSGDELLRALFPNSR